MIEQPNRRSGRYTETPKLHSEGRNILIISLLLGFQAILAPKPVIIPPQMPPSEVIIVDVPIASSTPPKPRIEQIKDLVREKDWDDEMALAIMFCESRNREAIRNFNPATGDDSYGLFQINLHGSLKYSRPSAELLKTAEVNIDYAYKLWQKRGWKDWQNCHNKVLYE